MKTSATFPHLAPFLRAQWREWRWYLIFLFCVWIPVRSVVADYNPVPSGSMNPTILEGDVVFVDKLAYGLRFPLTRHWLATWAEPARGEIVTVFSPADGTRLIKRIVGAPGDTIAMRGNHVFINGTPLDYSPPREDYGRIVPDALKPPVSVFAEEDLAGARHAVMAIPARATAARNFGPVELPAGRYFVMGDNRDNSLDSRYFGFVERESIVGRAEGVIVSWDIEDTWLPRPGRFFTGLR